MNTTTNLTPAQAIDTELAETFEQLYRIDSSIAQYGSLLADEHYTNSTQRPGWERKLDELRAERGPVADREIALQAQYTGWSRFFLVKASGGHIHSSMNCSTCYPTTTYGWLPTVSGLTEADAVAEFGPVLCSICYPSAPVEWTNGELHTVTAERDAKDAAKAEAAAKKLAKALLPDGSALRVQRDSIKTLAAAKMYLTDAAEWANIYAAQGREGSHPSFPVEDVARVAEAVAAKTGETVEQVQDAAAKRAAKR